MGRKMTVTMALIARRLNLSPATVSRVLSGKGQNFISESTRKRVIEVAAELGYVASRPDGSAPAHRMGVIALWIRNPNAPFYARIIHGMQSIAAAEGSDLILSGFNDEGGEPDFLNTQTRAISPSAWKVDGIIGVDCPRRIQAYFERAHARGRAVPVIVAGSEPITGLDSVTFDPHAGAEAATQHLLRNGRTRIAHLTGGCSIPSISLARAQMYERVIARAGHTPLILSARDETRAAARQCIRDAIATNLDFDAIFCLNDDMAIGAYRGLLDEGRRVPADVAIVGYDSIDDTEYLEVPITSVRQDQAALVAKSWELLWRRIAQPNSESVSVVLQPELVIRDSCGANPNRSEVSESAC